MPQLIRILRSIGQEKRRLRQGPPTNQDHSIYRIRCAYSHFLDFDHQGVPLFLSLPFELHLRLGCQNLILLIQMYAETETGAIWPTQTLHLLRWTNVAGLLALYYACKVIYRLYFSPISHVPGRKLAGMPFVPQSHQARLIHSVAQLQQISTVFIMT